MYLDIDLTQQRLVLEADGGRRREYAVSTGANGPGEVQGSGCTPRGRHHVRAKVGLGAAANTVFVARRPTGEVWSPQLAALHPRRDWILTRIFWLSGNEIGRNRLAGVDTFRRFIYIHGTPDVTRLGVPGSRGCVRMRNADIIELFDLVPVGTAVTLHE